MGVSVGVSVSVSVWQSSEPSLAKMIVSVRVGGCVCGKKWCKRVWMTRDAFLEFFVFNDKPIIEIDRQPQQQHHYHLRLRDDNNNGWWR